MYYEFHDNGRNMVKYLIYNDNGELEDTIIKKYGGKIKPLNAMSDAKIAMINKYGHIRGKDTLS